ncbi:MAG: single stranded DNA-binding domain-containing protein [Planctomycetota bacterium]|jgi:hypothetical protein
MSTVVAFVDKVSSKSGTGRNGKPYTLYSLKLMDESGSALPGWYQNGFDQPACKDGDYVKLDATPKGDNFEVVKNSIRVSKNPPAKPQSEYEKSNPRKGGGSGGATVKTSDLFGDIGGYNTEDDIRRMSWSAARSDAISVVELLVEAKALPLPAASSKAGAASRFDIITESVEKLTNQFFVEAATGSKIVVDAAVVDGEVDDEFDAPASDDGFDDASEGDDDEFGFE